MRLKLYVGYFFSSHYFASPRRSEDADATMSKSRLLRPPRSGPYPTPSGVDRNTWANEMARRSSDPLVFVIAGSAAVYCGLGFEGRVRKMNVVATTPDGAPQALISGSKGPGATAGAATEARE